MCILFALCAASDSARIWVGCPQLPKAQCCQILTYFRILVVAFEYGACRGERQMYYTELGVCFASGQHVVFYSMRAAWNNSSRSSLHGADNCDKVFVSEALTQRKLPLAVLLACRETLTLQPPTWGCLKCNNRSCTLLMTSKEEALLPYKA